MSTKIPNSVVRYLYSVTVKDRMLAALFVNGEGMIYDWYGNLSAYHIETPEKGQPIGSTVLALEGMFPLDQAIFTLPTVEVNAGRYADIHVLRTNEGHCVLLLDKNEEVRQQQRYQQRGNELNLLREKHTKTLQQFLGQEVADNLSKGMLTTRAWGERKNVTVLHVGVRDFTSYAEHAEPESVFETLNAYLQAMIDPVLDEKGIIDKIVGDTVTSLFGVVSADEHPTVSAVRSAMAVLNGVRELNRDRRDERQDTLEVGVGIASGLVALGILGTKSRRAFSAIGHHVNLADLLHRKARPGEIIIDNNTYERIGPHQDLFMPSRVEIEELEVPVTAFSYRVAG